MQTDRRLVALDEQASSADATGVVYEQRYAVDRVNTLSPPTFDGVALAGAESIVEVGIGATSVDVQSFAFPGIDGVFRNHLGTRMREINWAGQLRAADDTALNTIESVIEAAVARAGAFTMTDSFNRSFAECVCDRFVRRGPRRRHPVSGMALQGFELRFVQLVV